MGTSSIAFLPAAIAAGFVLGLSSGGFCLTACAPVFVPCLLGESRSIRADAGLLAAFLGGRLTGYLAFAILAWSAGLLLHGSPGSLEAITACTYLGLGGLMIAYGLIRPASVCAASSTRLLRLIQRIRGCSRPPFLPAILGLLTGLNLCPPFIAAFGGAAGLKSLAGSVIFFLGFFVGTSLLFLPFPALGALRRVPAIKTVGRLSAVVVGAIYVFMGFNMLA